MVSTVLGAVAELERSLIVERVKAGLRNARATGKLLDRPKVLDVSTVAALRRQGASWRAISTQLGVGVATLHRAAGGRSRSGKGILERNRRLSQPCRPLSENVIEICKF
jgi:DNA invertase Pin-like site-specific DNA recombinase